MINLNKEISSVPLPSSFNAQMKRYREKGLKRYSESGLPGKKVEHWMKFDINPLKEIIYKEALESIDKNRPDLHREFTGICERIDIINGFIQDHKGTGYRISTLSSGDDTGRIPELIGSAGDEKGNYFYNLNSSLFSDTILIRVEKDNKKRNPLYISQLMLGKSEPIISNSRIIVEIEEGAKLELIQSFSGKSSSPYLNNSVTEIILHKNARMDHVVLQEDSEEAFVFNNLFVTQGESSEYNLQTLNAGASISRNEYHINLSRKNSSCHVTGLFLGKKNQLHNSDVTIHHNAPACTSRTTTKAIAGGASQGVFRGFAIVNPGAQKSDAIQQFKSILLNDTCQINMEPHLEIWADDVKCSHGATVGQLDQNQLFYLQQRGFTPEDARKVLLEAFAADVAELISIEKVNEIIKAGIYTLMDDLYE
ncbi:MAG: Fe-S cluster assembly protein SufD [Spirochaetaceae bacterium]|nr:Fe-S cluster assembly protein SufD [Spirochaetaceae bacterium]